MRGDRNLNQDDRGNEEKWMDFRNFRNKQTKKPGTPWTVNTGLMSDKCHWTNIVDKE